MSRKSKIAIAEKARITQEYTAGNISREEAARRAGVVPDVITDWARIYRREGTLGLEPEEKNRVYSPELKKQAVLEYLSGGYIANWPVNRQHNIPHHFDSTMEKCFSKSIDGSQNLKICYLDFWVFFDCTFLDNFMSIFVKPSKFTVWRASYVSV